MREKGAVPLHPSCVPVLKGACGLGSRLAPRPPPPWPCPLLTVLIPALSSPDPLILLRPWEALDPLPEGAKAAIAFSPSGWGRQGNSQAGVPPDQQPRRGKGWPAGRGARSPAMLAAAAEGQPVALSMAHKAVCKVVYGAPCPHPLLLPVGLELWLYVQRMRHLQGKRCAGLLVGGAPGQRTRHQAPGVSAGGQDAFGGSRGKRSG